MAQRLKHLPAMQETWVWSLGREHSPGEGNGNPLQYSCLGNPMDRGIWRATVHGVAKSRTRLSNFTFTLNSTLTRTRNLRPRLLNLISFHWFFSKKIIYKLWHICFYLLDVLHREPCHTIVSWCHVPREQKACTELIIPFWEKTLGEVRSVSVQIQFPTLTF